ncbi:MAG: helix-turn-helix transcriptional regulator [Halanaeroarchaeum sp.]
MYGEGPVVGGTVSVNPVAQAAMDDPMAGTVLFVGVLAGLLLVSFLVGRGMTGSPSNEESTSGATRTGGSSDSKAGTTYRSRSESTVDWSTGDGSRDLDDDERVLTMLEDADGQLRQSRIVSETGWSKTKVSRTLSDLDDDGDVVKIQLGRENLICLPDQVPSIGHEEDR